MTNTPSPQAEVPSEPVNGSVGAELLAQFGRQGGAGSSGQEQDGTQPAAQAGEPEKGVPAPAGKAPRRVKVDWKGAEREVVLDDLVKAAIDADSLRSQNAAFQEMIGKNAAAQELAKALDAMDAEDGKLFMKALQDPRMLRQLRQAPVTQNVSKTEDDIEDLIGGGRRQEPQAIPHELEARLAKQEEALRTVLGWAQERNQREQQQSLGQQLDQLIDTFPVFKESDEGRGYARDAILREFAQSGGKGKLDDIVAKHATTMHKLLQGERQAAVPQTIKRDAEPRSVKLPDREKDFAGDDLESGRIGRTLLEVFGGRR